MEGCGAVGGRRIAAGTMALAVPALVAAVAAPGFAAEAAGFVAWNLLLVAPAVLVGIGLTAAVTAMGAMPAVATAFRGCPWRTIAVASAVGAVTPVCGITVLPVVAGMLAGGVPLAPIMAFWLSSPITDPGMLAVTAATLGGAFAVAKTAAAVGIGLLGGAVTLHLTGKGFLRDPARRGRPAGAGAAGACAADGPRSFAWRFWTRPARRAAFAAAFAATARPVVVWLALAFLAEFVLKRLLPADAMAPLVGGDTVWAVPLAAIVGAPVYLDGYAALPLVRGLMDAGMAPGAAMAFLVAGGIVSAWAVLPVFALVRLPVVLLYLLLAVGGSMLAGWAAAPFLG